LTAKNLQPALHNKTVLVTGFAPFGGEAVNPSYEAVKGLPDNIKDWQIVKAQLPVEYDGSRTELDHLIATIKPSIILCTGQAGGRCVITPEYVAINLQDSKSADNTESLRKEQKVSNNSPDAYFSSLPVFEIVRSLQEANIPAQVSYSAGTYVCNTVMYHLMQFIRDKEPQLMGGFIHVPYSCEQAAAKDNGVPSMPISIMTAALLCTIETCIDTFSRSTAKK
jgi:pyroglutamyl-peptidase